MFDLNKLVAEAYENERNKDFSFDRLVEMVESMMILQESLGVIKEEAPINVKAEKTEDLKPVKIVWRPYVQMSEVAWGSTAHQSADARDIDGDGEISIEEQNPAREQLKLYLSALPEGDIKQKLDALNAFIKNINSDSPAIDGIGKAVSFMMFYRTLYDIINDFNASAAGFIFESFLSVLLDAQSGHQIPAAGASTIADFVVYPNGGRIPISLKLYAAGSLKVGGSYVQLVKDLTGEFGMMQYIVITKISGDNDEIQKLKFYGFNFTLDNFAKILSLTGETGLDQMCLPEGITAAYTQGDKRGIKDILKSGLDIAGTLVKFKQTYDPAGASEFDPTGQFINPKRRQRFDIALDIPPKTRISIKPAFDGIEAALENKKGTALKTFLMNVGDRNADKIKKAFLDTLNQDFKVPSLNSGIDDIEIGQSQNPETPKVYAYNSKGTSTNIKTTTTMPKIYDAVLGVLDADQQKHPNLTKFTSTKDILRQFIKGVVDVGQTAQAKSPQPKEGEDPHTLRVKAIYGERSKEQKETSVRVLSDPDFTKTEKMRLLKLTAGYQGIGGDSQFELKTKAAFNELYKAEYAGELPYGPVNEDGSFAELVLTKEEVLKTCNNVLESFNRNMAEALNGMQMLVNDMNAYVLSGLKDDKKATSASQDAQIVKTSMDKQVQESAQNNTETP